MREQPLIWLLRGFFTLLFVCLVYQLWMILQWDHQAFLGWVNHQVKEESLIQKIQSLLSEASFKTLQKAGKVSLVFFLALYLISFLKSRSIALGIMSLVQETKQNTNRLILYFKNLSVWEKVILTLISILFLIKSYWYVFNWPMQYDEAWTFNHFIKRTWAVTLFAPHNNHMFYTVIAKVSYHFCFFLRPIEAIRLPLPIFALCSSVLLYRFSKALFNKRVALLTFSVFLGIGPVVFYSLYARAYIVGIFFSVVFLTQLYSFSKHRTTTNQFSLVLSAILAVYSIQSSIFFLIPCWIGGFFLIAKNKKKCFVYLLLSCIMLAGVLLIYAPIIITTKMAWLTESSPKHFDSVTIITRHFRELGAAITGIPWHNHFAISLLFASLVWGLISTKQKWFFGLSLFCIVFPTLAIIVKQQFLETRLFFYIIIFVVPAWAYFIDSMLRNSSLKKWIPILALLLFFGHSYRSHHQRFFNWSNRWDRLTERAFSQIKEREISEVYNYYFYAKPALEYFSFENDHELSIKMPQKVSIDYVAFAEKEWESILWWKEYKGQQPDLKNYNKVWDDDVLELYITKE